MATLCAPIVVVQPDEELGLAVVVEEEKKKRVACQSLAYVTLVGGCFGLSAFMVWACDVRRPG
jgi:hypothetical protein